MTRDQFWGIIANGQDEEEPGESVRAALQELSPSEIESYQRHFDELFDEAYRWDLWGAAYTLEGGCSDDGFTDFRYALISRGQKVFQAALKNPDSLVDVDLCSDELFGYIASEIYEAKTGKRIPIETRPPGPAERARRNLGLRRRDEVRRRLPKIAARLRVG